MTFEDASLKLKSLCVLLLQKAKVRRGGVGGLPDSEIAALFGIDGQTATSAAAEAAAEALVLEAGSQQSTRDKRAPPKWSGPQEVTA
jgi:hypothetical protein